jgi:hypothetical protein
VTIDLPAAVDFLTANGRVLDRRRLGLELGTAEPTDVLASLTAYGNRDGGYGWGLEPDLRSASSQPAAAMHALEVLAEVLPVTTPRAVELCDWLQRHTLPDGGLPFALPVADPVACAPFWVRADPRASSLQMTTQVAAKAHLLARHQPEVARHPWLAAATAYCLTTIRRMDRAPFAYELRFALEFLDAVADDLPEARELLGQLGRFVPHDRPIPIEGGIAGEVMNPLDLAPYPGRPVRALLDEDVISADLDRLARGQQPDGGWLPGFASYSPAAALEWRGYATVRAITVLRRNVEAQTRP